MTNPIFIKHSQKLKGCRVEVRKKLRFKWTSLWTWSIETTARGMSDGKIFKFFVKDAKLKDNLLKSIQIYLPLIPESVQGFFSVFKYNLKMSSSILNW